MRLCRALRQPVEGDVTDALAGVVESISRFAGVLQMNELATRYALVDPLLAALGWDLSLLDEVEPEYSLSEQSMRVDYAMTLGKISPRYVIEAKPLGSDLDAAVPQTLTYAVCAHAPYFWLTDGDRWRLYHTFLPAPVQGKNLVSFQVTSGSVPRADLLRLSAQFFVQELPPEPEVQDGALQ